MHMHMNTSEHLDPHKSSLRIASVFCIYFELFILPS